MPRYTSTPKHTHDCERCRFLGHHTERGEDIYACSDDRGAGSGTLIRRDGSDGPNYRSTPLAMIAQVARASLRAGDKGWSDALIRYLEVE